MNPNKICFIMCSNDEFLAAECLNYVSQLTVPDGYTIDTMVVQGAESMTAGYDYAMRQSDAKYKVYLHQDVLILNKNLIVDLLAVFQQDAQVGMIGLVGNTYLPEDGCPWSERSQGRIGEIYMDIVRGIYFSSWGKAEGSYQDVIVIDGLLMATQYDIPWRKDLFQGWDLYDCSQALEFWRAGYRVVVPYMESPWCLHDNDVVNLDNYDKWSQVFVREYKKDYMMWNQTGAIVPAAYDECEELKRLISCSRWQEARCLADQMLEKGTDSDIFWLLNASVYEAEANDSLMYGCISLGIQKNPAHYELYFMLGNYYLRRNINQAYLCYEQALFYCDSEEDQRLIREQMKCVSQAAQFCVHPVSIVILSYNISDILQGCIESIRKNNSPATYELVVVDNASTDGVTEWLKEQSDIVLACNEENRGFAGGCNQGIEMSAPENDILFLNNDTVVPPNALFWLRMGLYERNTVGAVGPLTNFAPNGQELVEKRESMEEYMKLAKRIHAPIVHPYENKLWLVGFAMLVRRSALNRVGGLDERYEFGNYEDNDYGLKLSAAGYELLLCYNSYIYHYGSLTMAKDKKKYESYLKMNAEKLEEKWGFYMPEYTKIRNDMIQKICDPHEASLNVLEVGCGCGCTLARVRHLFPNARTFGIEKEERAAAFGGYLGTIRTCDIERDEFPFGDQAFDYILLSVKSEHLSDPEEVRKKLLQYLKQNGVMIVREG